MKQLLITIAAVVLVGCGNGIKHPPLVKAIEKEDFETVKQLLTDGRNVNIKFGKFETTPLFLAAYKGNKEIIELLIASGAEINAVSSNGLTPTDWSSDEGIETLLRKHGGKKGAELH